MSTRLLIADDDESIREALAERFEAESGFDVVLADDGQRAIEELRRGSDVALLDLRMPRASGQEVLETAVREGLRCSIIVLTAHGDSEAAVRAMKAGAYDFVNKPFDALRLVDTVRRAAERRVLPRRASQLPQSAAPTYADPAMVAVMARASRAARTKATVLVLGESGVGKEVVARHIHAESERRDEAFIAVNCGAITESLLESELFGYEKGAFTGAEARRVGRIEAAHRGTLFLDEIGDTSPALQVKLLRVLQERSFQRVGSPQAVSVDVRLIAATHRDLKEEIAAGRFREDLYYRLAVVDLAIPPLRERPQDVLALAERFLPELAREMKRTLPSWSDAARKALTAHSWPGNVRELRNAIERALVLSEGDEILLEDLPHDLQRGDALMAEGDHAGEAGFHARVERYRSRILSEALEAAGGHQTKAAEGLGLQRSYFARLLKKYGIARE